MSVKQEKLFAFDFIPKDDESLHILKERARVLAKEETKHEEEATLSNYIRFRLGRSESYGISYEKTKEVMSGFLLTPVPHLPPFFSGVINFRGTLIAVINLKILFHIEHDVASENPQIIIVNKENMMAGLLVDDIQGNDAYDPSKLDLPISSQGIAPEFILGIDKGTTAIINIEKILDNINFSLDKKSPVL